MPIIFTNGDYLTLEMAENLVKAGVERVAITRHKPVPKEWDIRMNEICQKFPNVFIWSSIAK